MKIPGPERTIDEKTIEDFGAQWMRFVDNEGYHGSQELLVDHLEPLLPMSAIEGRRVGELGSGSGRIVNMLLDAGAASVIAVEPSAAFETLKCNTAARADKITYANVRGEDFLASDLDYLFSIGVLHHVTDPGPIIKKAYDALKPGGEFFVWVYGREGNEIYLAFVRPTRAITKRLPDGMLIAIAHFLNLILAAYLQACRVFPIPMRRYMLDYLAKLSRKKRLQTIFDQLNPAYAKYYNRDEAYRLLADAGFSDVRLHHRHGYSWSVIGRRE
jgi:SAM-dependent methyltransferase